MKRLHVGRAPGHVDLVNLPVSAGGQVEIERTLNLSCQTVHNLGDDLRDFIGDDPLSTAALVGLGLFLADAQLALNFLGNRIAAVDDIARECRRAACEDVEGRE